MCVHIYQTIYLASLSTRGHQAPYFFTPGLAALPMLGFAGLAFIGGRGPWPAGVGRFQVVGA